MKKPKRKKIGNRDYARIILGASTVLPVSAGGAVIYSGPQNITLDREAAEGPDFYVDFGFSDESYYGYIGTYIAAGVSPDGFTVFPFFNVGGRFTGDSDYYYLVDLVDEGTILGPGASVFNQDYLGQVLPGGLLQDFDPDFFPVAGRTGFIGVEFPQNGELHYGWINITGAADGTSVTINDWAFESEPNVAIAAGAIPEPSSLALLASGGVLAFRRKRVTKASSSR